MEAVQELREEYGLRVRDASHIYGDYNDLNDFLCGKGTAAGETGTGERTTAGKAAGEERQRFQDVTAQPAEGFKKAIIY